MTRAVVLQTAWLGDAVLTIPLLAALGERFGGVDVVTTPGAAPLLATHPAVRRVHVFDKRGRDRGLVGLLRVAARLRRARYRVAFAAQQSVRTGLLAWLAAIPERIGFAGAPGRWWYTKLVAPPGAHEAERLLALAGGGGRATLELFLTPQDHAAAEAALTTAGIVGDFVALAPESARPNKVWPHFRELAEILAERGHVVLLGDRRSALVSNGPFVADLRGGLSIRTAAAVLARARVAVTNDSAPLHMAEAVRTPVVALFGPTTPERGFGPRGSSDVALGIAGLPCRPCSTHGGPRCPLGHHRCLRELPVSAVLAAVAGVHRSSETTCV